MDKIIKITKPSGEDSFKLLSAFKVNEKEFIVLDSKLKDANSNVITFISKINGDNLEYVDGDDWNLVRDSLISIVKNTSTVEYIDTKDSYAASENIGHTLALKDAHINAVVSSYNVVSNNIEAPVVEESAQPEVPVADNNVEIQPQPVGENQNINPEVNINEQPTIENVNEENNVIPEQNGSVLENSINNVDMTGPIDVAAIAEGVTPETPVVPSNIVPEGVADIQPTNEQPIDINPVIEEQPVINEAPAEQPVMDNSVVEPQIVEQPAVESSQQETNNYDSLEDIDEIKNTIIKLCDKLKEKEEMINAKLEVANKAYENAQNVMNTMPQEQSVNNEEVISIQDYQPTNDQDLQRTLVA